VCLLRKQGLSYGQISNTTGLAQSTIQRIIKAKSSRQSRKGKEYKPKRIILQELCCIIQWVITNWTMCRVLYSQIKAALNIDTSTTIIRRALRTAGYRQCIACPRLFINADQAKRRLKFALQYRYWGTEEWKRVLWSDKATFETRKHGRIYVTYCTDKKKCPDCIKSVYRSGRVGVMI
jgi:hypothetical protein